MTTIYFAGGEDVDFYFVGVCTINTSTNTFRSAYARCSLNTTSADSAYWVNQTAFATAPTSFWFTARQWVNTADVGGVLNTRMLRFVDSSLLTRLQIRCSNATAPPTFVVEKVNTAGTVTTLTNTLTAWQITTLNNATIQIIINFVNAVSGSVDVYVNSGGTLTHVYNFTGDTTTETTAISGVLLGNGFNTTAGWSEIIVSDTDSREWSLQTLAPVANGNTHNFDTGSPAAANVNEVTLNDATLDGSTTAGQIDQYTIPAEATGTFSIVAVGMSSRMQKGATGPSKMDLGFHISSSDYWSSDMALTTTWASYQNWWSTSPATSANWSAYPTNVGLKSVT